MILLKEKPKLKKSQPERRCIVTHASQPKAGLIRFVVSPDNEIIPDLSEKLPGRGIWISAERAHLETAIDKKMFARAAKAKVVVPDDLLSRIGQLLVKRCQDLISMARRADQLVVGFDRVAEALERGKVGAVAIASDAGRGRGYISAATDGEPVLGGMTGEELATAANKGAISFAAILKSGLADALIREHERLIGIRPIEMDEKHD